MMTLTLIHHTDLATVPDRRFWDGECWVEEPRFYPPAVEAPQGDEYIGHVHWDDDEVQMITVAPSHSLPGETPASK
jgi:hypothetical protein